jgi:hypothetical protein
MFLEYEKTSWERTRAKGRTRYALVHGLFGWGGSMATIFGLGYALDGGRHWQVYAFVIAGGLLGGYFLGLKAWAYNERKYLSRN